MTKVGEFARIMSNPDKRQTLYDLERIASKNPAFTEFYNNLKEERNYLNYSTKHEGSVFELSHKNTHYNLDYEKEFTDKAKLYKRELRRKAAVASQVDVAIDQSFKTDVQLKKLYPQLLQEKYYREKIYETNYVDQKAAWLDHNDTFYILPYHSAYHTQVTSLTRKFRRKFTVFMGNGKGTIAWGTGSGDNLQKAFEKSILDCQTNLITIPLDLWKTTYEGRGGFHNHCEFRIFRDDSFDPAGYPLWCDMLWMAGLRDFKYKVIGKKRNKLTILYAFLDCVTSNMTRKMICEQNLEKPYKIFNGEAHAGIDPLNQYLHKHSHYDERAEDFTKVGSWDLQKSTGLGNGYADYNGTGNNYYKNNKIRKIKTNQL